MIEARTKLLPETTLPHYLRSTDRHFLLVHPQHGYLSPPLCFHRYHANSQEYHFLPQRASYAPPPTLVQSNATPSGHRPRNSLASDNTHIPSHSKSSRLRLSEQPHVAPWELHLCAPEFLPSPSSEFHLHLSGISACLLPLQLHTLLFVFNTSLACARKAKDPTQLFFFSLVPEKWANSQLQSLGGFPVWEPGNCQERRKPQPASGLCCHWPK